MTIDDFKAIPETHTILCKQIDRLDKIIFEAINEALGEFRLKTSQYRRVCNRAFRVNLKAPAWFFLNDIRSIVGIDDEHVTVLGTISDDDDNEEEVTEIINLQLVYDYYFDRPAFKEYFNTLYNNTIAADNASEAKQQDRIKESEIALLAQLKKKYE